MTENKGVTNSDLKNINSLLEENKTLTDIVIQLQTERDSLKEQADKLAVEFAKWCQLKGWFYYPIHNDWCNTNDGQKITNELELYEIFKQSKK